jgi:hypothetical protein
MRTFIKVLFLCAEFERGTVEQEYGAPKLCISKHTQCVARVLKEHGVCSCTWYRLVAPACRYKFKWKELYLQHPEIH